MLRKIRKLIFHPYRYFYDYLRKRLGFKKYFVTEVMKPYREEENRIWHKLLRTYPSLYLYDLLRKKLHKAPYPIITDYRLESISKDSTGRGKTLALVIELENCNKVYFSDAGIVLKALSKKEPYIAPTFLRLQFKGYGNTLFIGANAKIRPRSRIIFNGSHNTFHIGNDFTIHSDAQIIFNGSSNTMHIKNNCQLKPDSKVTFTKDKNCAFIGPKTIINPQANIHFDGVNSLVFLYGNNNFNGDAQMRTDCMLFIGDKFSVGSRFTCSTGERRSIIIGSDCMFSFDVYLISYEGHMLYDAGTRRRTSHAKSVIIGDHVWLGRKVQVLKGTHIGDGSMVGARSIVTKSVSEKTVCAGAPARTIRKNILWDRYSLTNGSAAQILDREAFKQPDYEYKPIGLEKLIKIDGISQDTDATEKLDLIKSILNEPAPEMYHWAADTNPLIE